MLRIDKRNIIWLGILSILMVLVIISPNIATEVQLLLMAVFALAMAGTLLAQDVREKVVRAITERVSVPLSGNRASSDAREAIERARMRIDYYPHAVEMIDIGVIAAQTGREGMVMRRTRSISKDDDGARPFVTLDIPPEQADRHATLRFEFIDQNGQEQYVHQMRVYLREGEMNVLADHHLPMAGNDEIAGVGDWDLRVTLDDSLIGLHGFQLSASSEEKRQRVNGQHFVTESDEARRGRLQDDPSRPMSLEDLLRDDPNERRR
jgi:hypothetical protein